MKTVLKKVLNACHFWHKQVADRIYIMNLCIKIQRIGHLSKHKAVETLALPWERTVYGWLYPLLIQELKNNNILPDFLEKKTNFEIMIIPMRCSFVILITKLSCNTEIEVIKQFIPEIAKWIPINSRNWPCKF